MRSRADCPGQGLLDFAAAPATRLWPPGQHSLVFVESDPRLKLFSRRFVANAAHVLKIAGHVAESLEVKAALDDLRGMILETRRFPRAEQIVPLQTEIAALLRKSGAEARPRLRKIQALLSAVSELHLLRDTLLSSGRSAALLHAAPRVALAHFSEKKAALSLHLRETYKSRRVQRLLRHIAAGTPFADALEILSSAKTAEAVAAAAGVKPAGFITSGAAKKVCTALVRKNMAGLCPGKDHPKLEKLLTLFSELKPHFSGAQLVIVAATAQHAWFLREVIALRHPELRPALLSGKVSTREERGRVLAAHEAFHSGAARVLITTNAPHPGLSIPAGSVLCLFDQSVRTLRFSPRASAEIPGGWLRVYELIGRETPDISRRRRGKAELC